MKSQKTCQKLFLSMVVLLFLLPGFVFAGGYLVVTDTGIAFKWDNTSPVPFNPDGGGFGLFTANPDAVAYTQDALDDWAVIPSADLTFLNAGSLPIVPGFDGDVDTVPEFFIFFNQFDGLSPVVFDEDGTLFDALFGANTSPLSLFSICVYESLTRTSLLALIGKMRARNIRVPRYSSKAGSRKLRTIASYCRLASPTPSSLP